MLFLHLKISFEICSAFPSGRGDWSCCQFCHSTENRSPFFVCFWTQSKISICTKRGKKKQLADSHFISSPWQPDCPNERPIFITWISSPFTYWSAHPSLASGIDPITKVAFFQVTNHIHVRDSRSPCLTGNLSHLQE